MRNFLGFLGLFVFVLPAVLRAADKPDPRENLDTLIPEIVRLLEKKEIEPLLKLVVAPKDMEKILTETTMPEFVQMFADKKADRLLQSMEMIKGVTPTFNEEKTEASFAFKQKIKSKSDIRFQKIDKYWYIKN